MHRILILLALFSCLLCSGCADDGSFARPEVSVGGTWKMGFGIRN